jgi:hypothetical protein
MWFVLSKKIDERKLNTLAYTLERYCHLWSDGASMNKIKLKILFIVVYYCGILLTTVVYCARHIFSILSVKYTLILPNSVYIFIQIYSKWVMGSIKAEKGPF